MVSDQTITKYAKDLMKQYKDLYAAHNKSAPQINSYRDLWGFRNMVEDLGKARAAEVVEYYFDFPFKYDHNVVELFRGYDSYSRSIDEKREDEEARKQIRLETQQRVKEWQSKNGERTGTTS